MVNKAATESLKIIFTTDRSHRYVRLSKDKARIAGILFAGVVEAYAEQRESLFWQMLKL
jgi:hypothetical protein